ncbi:uncharacterized protein VTP21DRAFT_2609 [Calcarisporiella thermophila]|uniref:uncharacterized protein n=1 Tax=Calcarisporiella thermophila TaxID=911321 RepID=UPI00374338F2
MPLTYVHSPCTSASARLAIHRNDWARQHGLHTPFDMLFLLQWLGILLLEAGYFLVFDRFISAQPGFGWVRWFMVVSMMLGNGLSIATSLQETEDAAVKNAGVTRSMSFVRAAGVSVISKGVCGICRVKVSSATRHCKVCNKCIAGMDHHCRWLNCCVGSSNYRLFCWLIGVAALTLLSYTICGFYIISLYATYRDSSADESTAAALANPWASLPETYAIPLLILVLFLSLLGMLAFLLLANLGFFHLYLYRANMSTVEWVNRPRRLADYYAAESDDLDLEELLQFDNDEDVDENDENPWRRPWNPPDQGVLGRLRPTFRKCLRLPMVLPCVILYIRTRRGLRPYTRRLYASLVGCAPLIFMICDHSIRGSYKPAHTTEEENDSNSFPLRQRPPGAPKYGPETYAPPRRRKPQFQPDIPFYLPDLDDLESGVEEEEEEEDEGVGEARTATRRGMSLWI